MQLADIARNLAADAVVNASEGGSIEFLSSADALLMTAAIPASAWNAAGTAGSAGGAQPGVAQTAAALTTNAATAAGTITKGRVKTSGGGVLWTFAVSDTTGAGDLKLSNPIVAVGETYAIASLSYTQPA